MPTRPLTPADHPQWVALRSELWPDEDRSDLEAQAREALAADPPLAVFLAWEGGVARGFIEVSLRSHAEGCAGSPVPFVEGWYVQPDVQGRGLGAVLMRAAEGWSRAAGYSEIGSDTWAGNAAGRAAHRSLGFEEVETLVAFRKPL